MFRNLRSYYLTAVSDLKYQGVEVLLWRIIVKLLSPVLRLDLQILFDYDLHQPRPQREPKIPITIEQATESDIDDIIDMQMQALTPEQAAQLTDAEELQYAQLLRVRATALDMYRRGMRARECCFVARADGAVVHSNWSIFHDCGPMEGRPVELDPGDVYTTDGHTAEAFRGLGIHEAVLKHMMKYAEQRGCHTGYTITDLTKAGSRRGVQRVGWRRRGTIMYVSLRGLKRTWLVRVGGDIEPMFARARASVALEP